MLDKTDAEVADQNPAAIVCQAQIGGPILKEVMTNEASTLLDTDAHNKAIDADAALQESGPTRSGRHFVAASVSVWDDDISVADESWPGREGD